MTTTIIFAKYPEPGKVKTRLGAEVGFDLAAELYRIFLDCAFRIVREAHAEKAMVFFEPEERSAEFTSITPKDFQLFPQQGADLGERLFNAFEQAFLHGSDKVIAIGSDSPTLPPSFLQAADAALTNNDLVLGPAEDGGYYLIGLRNLHQKLFENIKWSSATVLDHTIRQAAALNLRYHLLETWYDVDDKATLVRAAVDERRGAIRALLSRQPEKFRSGL